MACRAMATTVTVEAGRPTCEREAPRWAIGSSLLAVAAAKAPDIMVAPLVQAEVAAAAREAAEVLDPLAEAAAAVAADRHTLSLERLTSKTKRGAAPPGNGQIAISW